MNKFLSILRGINVSGQKKIKMAELKSLYVDLGFRNVQTYIQSGNVVFNTSIHVKSDLKHKIETAIQEAYGFNIPIEIRTKAEINSIIKNCPFGSIDIEKEGTKVLVTFLSSKPSSKNLEEIQKHRTANEKLVVKGTEVYLYCPDGYGRTRLSNVFLEKKLGVTATTRNWKSIVKFKELLI